MWQHFVAIGDSLTEGIGDRVEGYNRLGWVDQFYDLLAPQNPGLRYTNLGVRGLLSAEIRASQLAPALELKPDLVSVIAGGNDVMKGGWNPRNFENSMAEMLGQLVDSGATVITSTLPDFYYLPVPAKIKEKLSLQIQEMNAIIRQLAQRYAIGCAEAWNQPAPHQENFWSADKVHPNAYGYSEIARIMLQALESLSQKVSA